MKVLGTWAAVGRTEELTVVCHLLLNICAAYDGDESSVLGNMRYICIMSTPL